MSAGWDAWGGRVLLLDRGLSVGGVEVTAMSWRRAVAGAARGRGYRLAVSIGSSGRVVESRVLMVGLSAAVSACGTLTKHGCLVAAFVSARVNLSFRKDPDGCVGPTLAVRDGRRARMPGMVSARDNGGPRPGHGRRFDSLVECIGRDRV